MAGSEKNNPQKPPPSKTCRSRQRPNDGGAPARTLGYFMKLHGNGQSETRCAANSWWRGELREPDWAFLWWHPCRVLSAADTAAATEEGSQSSPLQSHDRLDAWSTTSFPRWTL